MIDFAAFETTLAAHLRDPAAPPPAGLAPARLAIYQELAFNNVSQLLGASFPRLAGALGEAAWAGLVGDFLRDWRATTPYFTALPEELLRYLETATREADPLWVRDLARFEALEVAVALDAADPAAPPAADAAGLRLNPTLRLRAFKFAVHVGQAGALPQAAPCYLALWRDCAERTQRAALTPATARLLELIARSPDRPMAALLAELTTDLAHPDSAALRVAARAMLRDLLTKELLLGKAPLD